MGAEEGIRTWRDTPGETGRKTGERAARGMEMKSISIGFEEAGRRPGGRGKFRSVAGAGDKLAYQRRRSWLTARAGRVGELLPSFYSFVIASPSIFLHSLISLSISDFLA